MSRSRHTYVYQHTAHTHVHMCTHVCQHTAHTAHSTQANTTQHDTAHKHSAEIATGTWLAVGGCLSLPHWPHCPHSQLVLLPVLARSAQQHVHHTHAHHTTDQGRPAAITHTSSPSSLHPLPHPPPPLHPPPPPPLLLPYIAPPRPLPVSRVHISECQAVPPRPTAAAAAASCLVTAEAHHKGQGPQPPHTPRPTTPV